MVKWCVFHWNADDALLSNIWFASIFHNNDKWFHFYVHVNRFESLANVTFWRADLMARCPMSSHLARLCHCQNFYFLKKKWEVSIFAYNMPKPTETNLHHHRHRHHMCVMVRIKSQFSLFITFPSRTASPM